MNWNCDARSSSNKVIITFACDFRLDFSHKKVKSNILLRIISRTCLDAKLIRLVRLIESAGISLRVALVAECLIHCFPEKNPLSNYPKWGWEYSPGKIDKNLMKKDFISSSGRVTSNNDIEMRYSLVQTLPLDCLRVLSQVG